jgi:hypothetical protein
MRSLAYECDIKSDRMVSLQLPEDVIPGRHQLLVIVDNKPDVKLPTSKTHLPPLSVGKWPENLSLRREDMYGNDGR